MRAVRLGNVGSVADAGLQKMGLQVLGVQRADGSYEGAPSADSILKPGAVAVALDQGSELTRSPSIG